ncbi:TPA: RNA helicase [Candidatus Dependentiae bacterium]|nr:MAG: DNA/RNA helicase, superfamily II [candidate division TM6 bacterium GW2011_GWF2_43_87]HBL98025.1 RNA helicase [Candidatus Dependentiae bacterium]
MIKQLFSDFQLLPQISEKLVEAGFTEPTEIQERAIPLLLSKERVDFHGQAQTGTGKTLAFGLPLLHRIDKDLKVAQALVVAPTRELAGQIADSLTPYAQSIGISLCTIYGGVPMDNQVRSLKRGTQLIIGTPGRINDHLNRKTLQLNQLKTLVLDEADIMLDMGFREEVDEILNYAPTEREIWLFSATVKTGIQALMREHMRNTVTVSASKNQVGSLTTKQYYCVVPSPFRIEALGRFIEAAPDFYGFIFCQTKILTSEVADQLVRRGYSVGALHGDMSQAQRNSVIKKFKDREYSIVVATDVAGRGIDIQDLTHVVNFSLPDDFESYIHRTGRTGRAGKDGTAITFVGKHQLRDVKTIERKFNITIEPLQVPTQEELVKGCLAKASTYLVSLEKLKLDHKETEPIMALMSQFDAQQLSGMLAQILHEKFLAPIVKESKLDSKIDSNSSSYHNQSVDPSLQELMFFVGTDDGVSQDDVVAHLIENSSLSRDTIVKIRMIRKRTFVHVPFQSAPALMDAVKNTTLAGRKMFGRVVEPLPFGREQRPERSFSRPRNGGGRRHERIVRH